MKKIILSLVLLSLAIISLHAQGVRFGNGTWAEILEKAKTENKTIFVDVYTKWCGPCKHVSETVFPQEKLGEYYNSHFINFKIDAESPEGKEFVKKYPIEVYPTFFYINGNGETVHKITGAHDADEFIAEAKMITMYARHGGLENMTAAIKNGTADKELLHDYYTSANPENKPAALNLYLKSLSAEELMDSNNKLIEEISLYDKELMSRLIREIIKTSNDGRFDNGQYDDLFALNIVFSVQYCISTFLNESIERGDSEWFDELLELKEQFNHYGGLHYDENILLDGDLNIIPGRGLFFATPEYIKLCYWAQNRENEKEFPSKLIDYMDKLIRENHVDSLLVEQNEILDVLKKEGIQGDAIFFAEEIFGMGNVTTQYIIHWTDYFWKLSPSNKKTRTLCSKWINHAFYVNPYNVDVAFQAADLSARIGNTKDAITILKTAILRQQELKREDPRLFRALELKLQDIKNGKL